MRTENSKSLINGTLELILKLFLIHCIHHSFVLSGVSVTHHGKSIEIRAPIVVSSVGLVNTYQKLLPPHIADNIGMLIGTWNKRELSLLTRLSLLQL